MRLRAIAWTTATLMALGAGALRAQTDPRLVDAVRAAQEGRGDSARTAVQRLLDATPPTDTLYPQILYTQAMVASSAGDMRRQLQRITVEYATSDWADDALLRLVQMDYATRNYDGAARNLERLRVDFPASPLMAQAAYWAGRTYFDSSNPQAACRWLADGMARARSDVELQNQLGYLYQRCDMGQDTATTAQGDTARRDSSAQVAAAPPAGAPTPAPGATPTPAPPSAPSGAGTPPAGAAGAPTGAGGAPTGAAGAPPSASPPAPPAPASAPSKPAAGTRTVYRVQIAAVGSRKAADEAARKARPLGLTVVTVQQGSLYKVRVGEYATREAAQTAASSLKSKLGGSPFVVSEP